MHTSLDGFVAGLNGEMDWIKVDEEMFDFVATMTDQADSALIGVLVNPNDPITASSEANLMHKAAHSVGQRIEILQAGTEHDIDVAFANLIDMQVGALVVAPHALFATQAHQLVALAVRHAIPTLYWRREFAEAGGLESDPYQRCRHSSATRHQHPYLYTIEDALIIRPGVRLFHATMDDGEPRLLMVYDLGKDPLAARENYEFYQREFKALKELSATGLVAEVSDPSIWSDDFLVIPIVPLKGKPLSIYPHPETREELAQELLLAAASFKGLDVIHSKKILHRAIGPDTFYVLQGGQTPKIAFTNFFAARIGTTTLAAPLDKLALAMEDPYASIEVAIGYEYATPATDIFSLALVFLERIAGVPIATIRASMESNITFLDIQQRWSSIPGEVTSELAALFKQIVTPETEVLPLSLKEIAESLAALAHRLRTEQQHEDKGVLLDNRFKVQRVLGQGVMAKTYLASYADYEDAGLVLLC